MAVMHFYQNAMNIIVSLYMLVDFMSFDIYLILKFEKAETIVDLLKRIDTDYYQGFKQKFQQLSIGEQCAQ